MKFVRLKWYKKHNDYLRIYSTVSIKKHPGLNFLQKSLSNDLVYLIFWDPQYMKIKKI